MKPKKVTLFTMLLYNLENNIRDIRPHCRLPQQCCEVCFILSYSREAVNEPGLLIITEIDLPLTLLAGSAPGNRTPPQDLVTGIA